MGSVEIYDYKKKRWVPYIPDHKKWEQHFVDVFEGRVRPDHKERYIVGSGSRWRPSAEVPKVELVTPVAQTIEMARSELKREGKKAIRGNAKKRKLSYNELEQP